MQINITGHHIELTPALRAFTEEKFQKLERHFDHINSIEIILNVEKLRQIVESTILINKFTVHASSEAEDMYTAIDLVIDKLDRQLVKHKEKLQDQREHRNHHDPYEHHGRPEEGTED